MVKVASESHAWNSVSGESAHRSSSPEGEACRLECMLTMLVNGFTRKRGRIVKRVCGRICVYEDDCISSFYWLFSESEHRLLTLLLLLLTKVTRYETITSADKLYFHFFTHETNICKLKWISLNRYITLYNVLYVLHYVIVVTVIAMYYITKLYKQLFVTVLYL